MQPPGSQVLIAANPKSGAASGRSKVGELSARLGSSGLTVEICESLDQLRQQSLTLHQAGQLRAVVSAGGDGTAAAVVNLVPMGVPIAILPLGTENLLAKYLEHSGTVEETYRAVTEGEVLRLDAGLAAGRLFLIMLGVGFDAAVVERMHAIRRGHINRLSYIKPIWQAIRSYDYPRIVVEVLRDEPDASDQPTRGNEASEQHEPGRPATQPQTIERLETAWLFAFNLPRYAAQLRFCPQACGTDGRLDLCAFKGGGLFQGISYFFWLLLGRHQRLRDFQHVCASRFRISSTAPVPYQVDGDPGGMLPLEVQVLPNRLTLLVPRGVTTRTL